MTNEFASQQSTGISQIKTSPPNVGGHAANHTGVRIRKPRVSRLVKILIAGIWKTMLVVARFHCLRSMSIHFREMVRPSVQSAQCRGLDVSQTLTCADEARAIGPVGLSGKPKESGRQQLPEPAAMRILRIGRQEQIKIRGGRFGQVSV
jgi:hypothetical protein